MLKNKGLILGIGTAIACVVLFLVMLANWPLYVVKSDERALLFTWGKISDQPVGSGLHVRVPIMQKVEKVSVKPMQLDHDVNTDAAGAITKDNQTIGASTSVFYRFDESNLVLMRKSLGQDRVEALLRTALVESFKETVGEYTIFDIAVKQEEIRGTVWEKLTAKLGNYPFVLTELRIQNYDWSDSFDRQIQATMEKAQQVKQAEQELLLTEQQANKQVKEAEAAKSALIAQAEGEKEATKLRAEAKALEGDGIRKYNEAIAANLDIELRLRQISIEQTLADRWDGRRVSQQNFTPLPFTSGYPQSEAKN